MNAEQLFDLFVAHGITTTEITQMDINTVTQHIAELRRDESDDIPMTDWEIAQAILDYARGEV